MLVALACWPAASGAGPLDDTTEALRLQADDAQWVMAAKNYASTRYSGLADITAANVGKLKLAWRIDLGARRGQEAGAPRGRPHQRHEFLHALQHLCCLGGALVSWHVALHNRHAGLGYGLAVCWLFVTSLHTGSRRYIPAPGGATWRTGPTRV
jgi:hypothetical protein